MCKDQLWLQLPGLKMPTIRVEQDVFEGLQALATPFTDTPNTVIKRLLDAYRNSSSAVRTNSSDTQQAVSASTASTNRPTPRGTQTKQTVYEKFLLHVLQHKFNGKATKVDATAAVISLMKKHGYITPADLEHVSTGETKAENTTAWGRDALKRQGLIRRDSERGTWELTTKGMERAESLTLPNADNQVD